MSVVTSATDLCGRRGCGAPSSAHEGGSPEETEIMLALIGCKGFAVSRAAVAQVRREAATPGKAPLCGRCLKRGHVAEACPW